MSGSKTKKIFLKTITIASFCFGFYLLQASNAWAKGCSQADIESSVEKLNNPDEWVFTIAALRKCGSPAVQKLTDNLQNRDEIVRLNAASALGSMGVVAKAAIPDLISTLKDSSSIVRSSAASALGGMGLEAKSAIPALSAALQDEDRLVRFIAALTLSNMGIEAKSTIPVLTEALQDKDSSVRSTAAYALSRIGTGLQQQAKKISSSELDRIILELDKALQALSSSKTIYVDTETKLVSQSLRVLKAEQDTRWFERTSAWVFYYREVAIAVAFVISLASFWSLIFWLRPLWLLHINNTFKKYTSITLPKAQGTIEVPVRFLLLVGFFHHHPRVLDAWVSKQISSTKQELEHKAKRAAAQQSLPHLTELDRETLQKYAKAIAWQCLKQTYQPASVVREQLLVTLAAINGRTLAEVHLQHLENLGTIQTFGKTQARIRFTHDLLAEYLASLYLVELCGSSEANWRKFLARVDVIPNRHAAKGFLLAVRDCSLALQATAKIPKFVPEEIGKQIGLVAKLTGQAQVV
jgi:hypothetical protein